MVIDNNSMVDTNFNYEELTLFDLIKDLYKCKWIILSTTIFISTIVWVFLNFMYPVIYTTECFISIDAAKINLLKNFFSTDFNKEQIIRKEVLSTAIELLKKDNITIKNLKPFLKIEDVEFKKNEDTGIETNFEYDLEKKIKLSFICKNNKKFQEKVREEILYAIIESYKIYLKNRFLIILETNSVSSTDEYYNVVERLELKLNDLKEYIDNDISFIEKNYYLPEMILNLRGMENDIRLINGNDIVDIKSEIINKCIIKDKKVRIERIKYNIDKLNSQYQNKVQQVKTATDLINLIKDKEKNSDSMNILIHYAWDSNSQALKLKVLKDEFEAELKKINQNMIATETEINDLEIKLSNLNLKVNRIIKDIKDWRFKYADDLLDNQINITTKPANESFRNVHIYKYLLLIMFFSFTGTSFICIIALYIKRNIVTKLIT